MLSLDILIFMLYYCLFLVYKILIFEREGTKLRYKRSKAGNLSGYKYKKRRRKRLDMKKIAIVAASTALLLVGGYIIYLHLPFVKVNKAIAAGDKYTENADYEAAIESYTKAIDIDSKSVKAYANLAGAYLSMDDSQSAKDTLYSGWENTNNEALLDNYHIIILNESVTAMNEEKADLDTVKAILSVLVDDNNSEEALKILDAASERCFESSYGEDADSLFRSDNSSYSEYEDMIRSMLSVYQNAPSDELKKVILSFVTPNISSFSLNLEDVLKYKTLISDVTSVLGTSDEIDSFTECLDNSQEVLSVFSGIFEQLDVGNVDELRNFVVSDEYISLRDVFLNKQETPLENTTYVPISREGIVLNCNEDKWSYHFFDFDENPSTSGVITLWANFFEDDGVQRASISYEPAAIDNNLYPHTQYSVTYLYSYITSGNSTKVAKMNYRLDTTITYEDGTIDETIVGDWGGANEWVMDIDTIESRIKA